MKGISTAFHHLWLRRLQQSPPRPQHQSYPHPQALRRAQISARTQTYVHIHTWLCTQEGSAGSSWLVPPCLPAQPLHSFHATHFQTQLSMMLEHETHPAGSDFCSYPCTHPCPMTASLPGTAGCSLAASPQPHGGLPDPFPARLPRRAGEGKGPAEQGTSQQPFHGGLFCRSHQAHASSPGASRAPGTA